MRFIIIGFLAATLALAAAVGYGAQTAKITVDKEGSYYYWFTYSDISGKQITTSPSKFTDKKTTAELPLVKDAVPKCTLFVLNEATGNEAVLAVEGKPGQSPKFDLKPSSFDRVRRVEVIVLSSAGQPAAGAVVKLDAGDKKRQIEVLDPSSQGIVEFTDVPSGTVKLTVEYGEGKTTSQDVEIPLDREERVPRVQIPVVGQIDTVQAAETSGEGGRSTGTSKEPLNSGFNFVTALIGLILFVVVVYGAVAMMRNRGAGFRRIMKRAGINLPGEPETPPAPSEPAQAAPVDPTICPFCGQKKDLATGACACSIVPGAATTASAGETGPRLVATQGPYLGSIYALDAATSIGREEPNTIVFPQDSTVSRKHARIANNNGEFTIADEGSSNGTFVNGVKITEQVLRPGDEIQIGATRLRFEA
ncbi:MAG: FHA domain-containing protein [Armatimonadetes bacterium]|nr:FHA domain-containing protein [Armatimonadota bacterium]